LADALSQWQEREPHHRQLEIRDKVPNELKIGIDLGSRKAKFALVRGTEIVRLADLDTISFYKKYGRIVGDELSLDLAGSGIFSAEQLACASITVTGYGRNSINLHGARVISEIKAHVAGARAQTGLADFTMLDMGGQDTKVAQVVSGRLADFVMNDKCAASSGRYLENMAAVLEVSLEELSSHSEEPIALDATCGIFGESELIGQILRGHPLSRLCAGVNLTLVKRVMPMLKRFPSETLVITGGVALNAAMVELLTASCGMKVVIPAHPQHNGAIGCASLG
jgi:(R)-2-hydroxyacyl-CoA dehydratese activating ATPase